MYYIFHNNLIFWHIITLLLHIVVREDFVGKLVESLFEPAGAFFLFLLLFFLFAQLLSLRSRSLRSFSSFSRCALAARAATSCSFSASSSTNMSTGLGGTLEAGCCTGFTSCRQQFRCRQPAGPAVCCACRPSWARRCVCGRWSVRTWRSLPFQSCSLYGRLSQDSSDWLLHR